MKPVFIVLKGPSVQWLADHIGEFKDADVVWATVNDFWIYDFMPHPFDIVHYSACVEQAKPDELERLNRLMAGGGSVITSPAAEKYFSKDYPGKLLTSAFSTGRSSVLGDIYNSLSALLLVLISFGYKTFYLFGCDGSGLGYKQNEDNEEHRLAIQKDAKIMNKHFWKIAESFHLNCSGVKIYNVNAGATAVKCFPVISHSQFLRHKI